MLLYKDVSNHILLCKTLEKLNRGCACPTDYGSGT